MQRCLIFLSVEYLTPQNYCTMWHCVKLWCKCG